jgi:hypothetical protein
MSLPDLRALLASLAAAEVEYIVVGGIAIGLHGYVRATADLEIVPAPDPENLDRLCRLLASEPATLLLNPNRTFGSREAWMLRRGRNVSLSMSDGDVDIIRTLPGVPDYATLLSDAERYEIDGLVVVVASPQKLIEMKQARGSKQDQADIDALRALDGE